MDLAALRAALELPVKSLGDTHQTMSQEYERLGLTEPPLLKSETPRSKARRAEAVWKSLGDDELEPLARRLVADGGLAAGQRIAIEDLLWSDIPAPSIPMRVRREIAAALDLEALSTVARDRFYDMLEELWDLGPIDLLGSVFGNVQHFGPPTLRHQINQHFFRNADWTSEELFDKIGALDAPARRFNLFLEALVSHHAVPNEPTQRATVEIVNRILRPEGIELRETGAEDGYPVFEVMATTDGPRSKPKNLIFASTAKPDLRLSNALDNHLELMNEEQVLVYDEPIPRHGLRWGDLQAWWQRNHPDQDNDQAKRELYNRLKRSLPKNSPPQANLFRLYYEIHRESVYRLPALLPEIWLYWDPKTSDQRGTEALLKFRMDFLLLLPDRRIVLEVDGVSHYTNLAGEPSPQEYAKNAKVDRAMKLSGFDVYRFGGAELSDVQEARAEVTRFFRELFAKYEVTTEP
ncbi:hypothetical protein [Nocardia cyriacigeorgica]|uniref:AbiJ-related protein n=1 Tax=Nocardia cyriacigeorgica TaxID=135487 RepID=UPI00189604EA|nr:hypothetical protein [Nocardia cyriacigeorgica]MBF6325895.1 hypothetical protein [Nocardia cyriacigeorgica]